MDGFHAYIVDREGHVINRVDMALEKEEDAAERAKRLVDRHDVVLWQRDRKIATLKHQP
jgi:glutathione peroxidase-family protein